MRLNHRIAMHAARLVLATVAALTVMTVQGGDAGTTAYLAARDKAVAEFKHVTTDSPAVERRHDEALHQLQGLLRAIIEPVRLDGYASSGTYNIETLFPELGYGMLDAIVVKSLDGKSKAVVSTEALLASWLKSNPDILPHSLGSSASDIAEAFASEDFYTSALSSDTHYYRYAELPVRPATPSDRVYAFLYAAGQDITAPDPPDGMVVAVLHGGRVAIFDEPATAPDSPTCRTSYKQAMTRAEAVWAEYRASKLIDKAKADKATAMEEAAARAFYQCYAQQAPGTAAYAGLVREAQRLVDKVQ